jgi:hypothetical protein
MTSVFVKVLDVHTPLWQAFTQLIDDKVCRHIKDMLVIPLSPGDVLEDDMQDLVFEHRAPLRKSHRSKEGVIHEKQVHFSSPTNGGSVDAIRDLPANALKYVGEERFFDQQV